MIPKEMKSHFSFTLKIGLPLILLFFLPLIEWGRQIESDLQGQENLAKLEDKGIQDLFYLIKESSEKTLSAEEIQLKAKKIAAESKLILDPDEQTLYLVLINSHFFPKLYSSSKKERDGLFDEYDYYIQRIANSDLKSKIQTLAKSEEETLPRQQQLNLWYESTGQLQKALEAKHAKAAIDSTKRIWGGILFYSIGLIGLLALLTWLSRSRNEVAHQLTTIENQAERLAQINQLLDEAQSASRLGSWTFSLKTGEIYWSPQLYDLHPMKKGDPPPDFETLCQMVHPEDRERFRFCVSECATKGTSYKTIHRIVFPDRILWMEGHGHARRDSEGKIYELFGTAQDVTSRIEIEQKVKFLLDSLNIGFWDYNPNTQALEWDSSMFKLFELPDNQFTNHYDAWEKSLDPESKAEATQALEKALRGEQEFNSTFKIITPSGAQKFIGSRAIVVRDVEGKPLKMYGINWDQTAEVENQKVMQEAKTRAQIHSQLTALGEMSAGIAHEINNPLTIISGNIENVIRNKGADETSLKKLEAALRSTQRVAKIVRGLGRFARQSHLQIQKSISFQEILSDVEFFTNLKTKEFNVPIQFDFPKDLRIDCDPVQMEQVLINLINNSIDAIRNQEEKWVKVEARLEGSEVVMRVIDSGKGISPELENKLFQPFFTTKDIGKGTGLGLSITLGIIQQHSGTIRLKRNYPNTCFEIRWPKSLSSPAAAA